MEGRAAALLGMASPGLVVLLIETARQVAEVHTMGKIKRSSFLQSPLLASEVVFSEASNLHLCLQ